MKKISVDLCFKQVKKIIIIANGVTEKNYLKTILRQFVLFCKLILVFRECILMFILI